jgi:colicin import membrane protein
VSAAVQSPLLGRRDRLWPLVVVSAALHAGFIVLAVVARPAPVIDLQQKPIVAKLVRLGQKRPEAWLPRKEPAAPPPAPATPQAPIPVAKPEPQPPPPAPAPPSPKPKEAPAPKPKPRPAAAPRSSAGNDVLASVLSRVKREKAAEEPVYGDPEGDPLGDASEASAGDRYLALVQRALRESYVLPATISERDRLHLRATVLLFIDAEGRILRHTFESRSGNEAFDAALERAIDAARLPPPPMELRQKYRTEGLGVIYRQ